MSSMAIALQVVVIEMILFHRTCSAQPLSATFQPICCSSARLVGSLARLAHAWLSFICAHDASRVHFRMTNAH